MQPPVDRDEPQDELVAERSAAQGQLDLRAVGRVPSRGPGRGWERDPAIAAQAPVPPQPLAPVANDERVLRLDLRGVGADQLVTTEPAGDELVVESGTEAPRLLGPGQRWARIAAHGVRRWDRTRKITSAQVGAIDCSVLWRTLLRAPRSSPRAGWSSRVVPGQPAPGLVGVEPEHEDARDMGPRTDCAVATGTGRATAPIWRCWRATGPASLPVAHLPRLPPTPSEVHSHIFGLEVLLDPLVAAL